MVKNGISIIVPAFNEAINITQTLFQIVEATKSLKVPYEIIVVNDGSSDSTEEEAKEFAVKEHNVKVITNKINLGFGASYIRGLNEAQMEYCMMVPGDNAYPAKSLVSLFSYFGSANIVCSYTSNTNVRSKFRSHISKGFTHLINLIFNLKLKYYNGISILPTHYVRGLKLSSGFAFLMQTLVYLICDLGLSYHEVPVEITERNIGKSKLFKINNIISVIIAIVQLIWNIRIKSFFYHSIKKNFLLFKNAFFGSH